MGLTIHAEDKIDTMERLLLSIWRGKEREREREGEKEDMHASVCLYVTIFNFSSFNMLVY